MSGRTITAVLVTGMAIVAAIEMASLLDALLSILANQLHRVAP